jgi:hypothetical protein
MFVNDLFKLIENSNEEYYAVYNQRGKPMIMRKPAGKTAQAYAEEKNLTIKGGPFDSHNETESFWIRSVLPAKKEQGMAEDSNQSNPDAKKNVKSAEEIIRALRPDLPPDWKYKPPADQESKPAADNRKERLRKDITAVDYNKEQQPLAAPSAEQKADIRRAVSDYNKEKQVKEAGPFSYGARKPRKGSVADLAAKKRQEQERGQQPIEPKNQRVGTAKVVKEFLDDRNKDDDDGGDGRGRKSPKARARAQVLKMYGDGDITFRKTSNGGYFIQHEDDFGDTNSHQYDPQTGRVDFSSVTRSSYYGEGVAEGGFDIPEIPRAPQPRPEPKNKALGEDASKYMDTNPGSVTAKQADELGAMARKAFRPDLNPDYYKDDEPVRPRRNWDYSDPDVQPIVKQWMDKNLIDRKPMTYQQGIDEDFDDLDRFMKDKYGPKPKGGSGIKRGDYGQPGRKRGRPTGPTGGEGSGVPQASNFSSNYSERSAGRKLPRFSDDYDSIKRSEIDEESTREKLHRRHQELRKKSGLPDPDYYKELKASYDLPDAERYVKQKEIKKKYNVTNEDRERYLEELGRAGYEIINERRMTCPECGGAAYADRMLAEKQDACYHKVKSRYKVWPSAYASGALVRCRKKGAKNWGNKSKK